MVLAQRVGKERSFIRGFFLSLATAGFYSVYWNYKAHIEIYRQFELSREDRDEGVIWYLLGLLFPPLVFGYLWTFSANVAYVRQRLMLPPKASPRMFVSTLGAALGVFIVSWILIAVALTAAESSPEESSPAADAAAGWALMGFGVMVVLAGIAYRALQRSINEVWRAFDARVAAIKAAPAAGLLEVAPPLDVHPTTWTALTPR